MTQAPIQPSAPVTKKAFARHGRPPRYNTTWPGSRPNGNSSGRATLLSMAICRPQAEALVHGQHDLQRVHGQLAAGAMRAAVADGVGHVGDADAAAHFGAVRQRNLAPRLCAGAPKQHRSTKPVWVRHHQRAFGAIDFDVRQVVCPDVKAHHDCGYHTVCEVQRAGQVRRHIDVDHVTIFRLAGDHALREGDLAGAGDARYRAEQVDQRGDVVGAHVQHRTAARLVEEGRVRVPVFVTVANHERGRCNGSADPAIVNQFATGLQAAAEEGVRRAADAQSAFAGRSEDAPPV